MGYLPEALVNYLALLGWGAEDGKSETFTLDELAQAFSLERVTPSPAIFDFDKLNWLNRHYLKQAAPERLAELAWSYFAVTGAGFSRAKHHENSHAEPQFSALPQAVQQWFLRLLALFIPAVDHLDQLPAKAAPVFGFDAAAARSNEENAAILAADSAGIVLAALCQRVRAHDGAVTPEIFKLWMGEIKTTTGVKGKELFHPVRIALTGAHSGPEFDKLLPLIEEGAALGLDIFTVRQRIEAFAGA
jgi:glutamyl/glutaminyl-tRNA synthetase